MDYEWNDDVPVQSQTFYSDHRGNRGNRDQYYNDRGSRDQQYSDRGSRDQQYGRQRNDRFSSGGGSRQWRDRNSFDNNYEQRSDGQKQTIKVPSRFVGRIIGNNKNKPRGCIVYCCIVVAIGRGGSKINDLQYESGCRINVTKEQDGDETLVVLTGDEVARQKAEGLISELTVDRGERPTLRVVDPSAEGATNGGSFGGETEVIDWQKLSEECVSMIFLSILHLL